MDDQPKRMMLFIGGPIGGSYKQVPLDKETNDLPETKMIQVPGALALATYTRVQFGARKPTGEQVFGEAYAYLDGPNPDVGGMLSQALVRLWLEGSIAPPLEEDSVLLKPPG